MEKKTKVTSMRLAPKIMTLLETMAEREHRPVSNMVEWMILKYAERNGISLDASGRKSGNAGKRALEK